jgi:hypothetical protein
MVPQTTPNSAQHTRHEPLYDVHPRTGISIEVFYDYSAADFSVMHALADLQR